VGKIWDRRVERARALLEADSGFDHLHPRDRYGKFRDSLGRSLRGRPVVGQIMTKPRPDGPRRTELHIHRHAAGNIEVRAVDGELKPAKEDARQLLADPDVYRVDLRDPLKGTTIWSTDDERLPGLSPAEELAQEIGRRRRAAVLADARARARHRRGV
jgi:hypothetical protein